MPISIAPTPKSKDFNLGLFSPPPSPSPSPVSISSASDSPAIAAAHSETDSSTIDFSPPLIAMVIVVATAFLIVTYSRQISKHITTPMLTRFRRWRQRRRRRSHVASSAGDVESSGFNTNSNFFDPADGYQIFSPYGLDDSVIKTIPLSIFKLQKKQGIEFFDLAKDCAVCLLEFEENDYVRTLPICSHAFHVDCIDIWLRSHANCPLCRARIFRPESPFVPLMAGRIRPSLDGILESILLEPLDEIRSENEPSEQSMAEISQVVDDPQSTHQQDETFNFNLNRRNPLLKRSYSFGFERGFQSERLVLEPATTSPWRYSRRNYTFWKNRLSPFGSLTKPRVFSFRSTRLTKSPFFSRRRGVFFPFSESSRRSKSMASPAAGFSSSRLRCGDPEALLSPERYNRR
uniref:RING-type E3 ubiquitin transferase n=1 Tax=Kalanchoe fedtschenkoi TaxID=63787 RepID=A0A7N0TDJ4_KALFE